jgi:hypothetical protein
LQLDDGYRPKDADWLDEGRTLILAAQILLGAPYRTIFEPGYQQFSPSRQYLVLAALALNIFSGVLLIAPAPDHQIVEKGEHDPPFNAFVMRAMAARWFPLPPPSVFLCMSSLPK